MKIHTKVVIDLITGEVVEDAWYTYDGAVAFAKSKTTTTSQPAPLSPEERRLLGVGADIGEQQLQAILGQTAFQNLLYGLVPGLVSGIAGDVGLGLASGTPPAITPAPVGDAPTASPTGDGVFAQLKAQMLPVGQDTPVVPLSLGGGVSYPGGSANFDPRTGTTRSIARSSTGDPIDEELLNLQLGQLRGGGAATPQDIALINEAIGAQLEAGASDISNFYRTALSDLKQELAPSLGLRPDDSPILDRGGRLATEATRQFGQLVSNLRSNAANQALQFPLQRTAAITPITGMVREFQEQLKQQAFANRASLLQTVGSFGLGLAGQGPTALPGVPRDTTQRTSDPFGAAAGIGSLLYGIGSLSSRRVKENQKPLNEEDVLNALMDLNVERWTYKGEKAEHIGPYAEDFKEKFGVGDGHTLALVDVMGVLLASMKALAKQVARIEERMAYDAV